MASTGPFDVVLRETRELIAALHRAVWDTQRTAFRSKTLVAESRALLASAEAAIRRARSPESPPDGSDQLSWPATGAFTGAAFSARCRSASPNTATAGGNRLPAGGDELPARTA
jgi:hypothetical protein